MSNVVSVIRKFLAAGSGGIVLTSHEPEEALTELSNFSREQLAKLREAVASVEVHDKTNYLQVQFWDLVDGQHDHDRQLILLTSPSPENEFSAFREDTSTQKATLAGFLQFLLEDIRARESHIAAQLEMIELNPSYKMNLDFTAKTVVIRNFDRFLFPGGHNVPDLVVLSLCQKILAEGKAVSVSLIFQTYPGFELPPELMVHCEYVSHNLPTTEERIEILKNLKEDEVIDQKLLNATAGLSRLKVEQYAAESLVDFARFNPMAIFKRKAQCLARESKLEVWSPEFVSQIRLWPTIKIDPELEEDTPITEVMLIDEQRVGAGEVRARIRYTSPKGKIERWLDPMPSTQFETLYRPERDFYSFKNVVGFEGQKSILHKNMRMSLADRAKLRHIQMVGVPGVGKTHWTACTSGEFGLPMTVLDPSKIFGKYVGDTEKNLATMLKAVEEIGGILRIDEFQRFMPKGQNDHSGGVEERFLGTFLTWFNDQRSVLVISSANDMSKHAAELTRSGRVDGTFFVGYPGRETKDAAWKMYMKIHELPNQALPNDNFWTPSDIVACCRWAELLQITVVEAANRVRCDYSKNQEQMDKLMEWAEDTGCICSETGERYVRKPNKGPKTSSSVGLKKTTRSIKGNLN
jgi:hypothetical protein